MRMKKETISDSQERNWWRKREGTHKQETHAPRRQVKTGEHLLKLWNIMAVTEYFFKWLSQKVFLKAYANLTDINT